MNDAKRRLVHGNEFPYDEPDSWWYEELEDPGPPSLPMDWAHAAARGVVCDLKGRRKIKDGFNRVDENIRKQIVLDLAAIIRQARFLYGKPQ